MPHIEIRTRTLATAVSIGLGLLVCAIGMLGWLKQGPDMFMALAGSGLAMCF